MVKPRATVLAVIRASNEAWLSLAGTLAWYGWRGVRTVLVVVGGLQDEIVRERARRSVSLLQTEQHFHWESLSDESLLTERLTRTLRAFQPHALLCTTETLSFTRHAWQDAINLSITMPGLSVVDPAQSRVWMAVGPDATLNVSATRGVKHALRLLYLTPPTTFSFPLPTISGEETFTYVAGARVDGKTTDLLDGFAQVELQDPIYFEERRGFSTPISTHEGVVPQ